jgi:hypothetical protein
MGWKSKMHGRDEKSYSILVGTPEGKRSLGRLRHRWEDIKMVKCPEDGDSMVL